MTEQGSERERQILDEFYERVEEVGRTKAVREIARALVVAEFECKEARDRIEELEGALRSVLDCEDCGGWGKLWTHVHSGYDDSGNPLYSEDPGDYEERTCGCREKARRLTASEASPREEQP